MEHPHLPLRSPSQEAFVLLLNGRIWNIGGLKKEGCEGQSCAVQRSVSNILNLIYNIKYRDSSNLAYLSIPVLWFAPLFITNFRLLFSKISWFGQRRKDSIFNNLGNFTGWAWDEVVPPVWEEGSNPYSHFFPPFLKSWRGFSSLLSSTCPSAIRWISVLSFNCAYNKKKMSKKNLSEPLW